MPLALLRVASTQLNLWFPVSPFSLALSSSTQQLQQQWSRNRPISRKQTTGINNQQSALKVKHCLLLCQLYSHTNFFYQKANICSFQCPATSKAIIFRVMCQEFGSTSSKASRCNSCIINIHLRLSK